jgi:hypothetical protein
LSSDWGRLLTAFFGDCCDNATGDSFGRINSALDPTKKQHFFNSWSATSNSSVFISFVIGLADPVLTYQNEKHTNEKFTYYFDHVDGAKRTQSKQSGGGS